MFAEDRAYDATHEPPCPRCEQEPCECRRCIECEWLLEPSGFVRAMLLVVLEHYEEVAKAVRDAIREAKT